MRAYAAQVVGRIAICADPRFGWSVRADDFVPAKFGAKGPDKAEPIAEVVLDIKLDKDLAGGQRGRHARRTHSHNSGQPTYILSISSLTGILPVEITPVEAVFVQGFRNGLDKVFP